MVFDMDGVLLKNRNSWDVIIHRSMNKRYSGPGMKYTFDYVYRNGVPEHLYENLTETKIRTYLNLNDVSSNVLRTIEYLKDRKIKTAIVSAGSHVFAGYLADGKIYVPKNMDNPMKTGLLKVCPDYQPEDVLWVFYKGQNGLREPHNDQEIPQYVCSC